SKRQMQRQMQRANAAQMQRQMQFDLLRCSLYGEQAFFRTMPSPDIFAPFTINKVRFRNRLIRSSIGGRNAYYDGAVNNAFVHFERRFAVNNIGGLISATFTVDHSRWSPLEYPAMSSDEFIKPLKRAIRYVKSGQPDMPYILQIGDPGYHTQTSL